MAAIEIKMETCPGQLQDIQSKNLTGDCKWSLQCPGMPCWGSDCGVMVVVEATYAENESIEWPVPYCPACGRKIVRTI